MDAIADLTLAVQDLRTEVGLLAAASAAETARVEEALAKLPADLSPAVEAQVAEIRGALANLKAVEEGMAKVAVPPPGPPA